MNFSVIPISANLQSLAARYGIEPLRVLEVIEEEIDASGDEPYIIFPDEMITPDLRGVAEEQNVTPGVVLMALDTEMYYRSLSKARSCFTTQDQ